MTIRIKGLAAVAVALGATLVAAPAQAAAVVGQPAPEFSIPDTAGATQSLGAYKGKFVVLEWVNFECPFVGKHYGSGHMQKLQKDYTGKGVVWLSVNSAAAGPSGRTAWARSSARIPLFSSTHKSTALSGDSDTDPRRRAAFR